MSYAGYIFGGKGLPKTPEELARLRELASRTGLNNPAPKNIGEGFNSIGDSLLSVAMMNRADRGQAEGEAGAQTLMQSLAGGQPAPQPAMNINPQAGPIAVPRQGGGYDRPEARAIYERAVAAGYSPVQASAFTGSALAESSYRTDARNPGDGRDGSDSIGLFQWNGGRAGSLKQFAAAQGKDWRDRDVQVDFAIQEAKGPEKFAGDALRAAKTPEEASAAMLHYLRPGGYTRDNPLGASSAAARVKNTNEIYGLYGQGGQQPQAAQAPDASGEVARLTAAVNHPSFAFLPKGQQEVLRTTLQARLAQANRDPVDTALKQAQLTAAENNNAAAPLSRRQQQLSIQKAEAEAAQEETDKQVIGGNLYERPKGSKDPWKLAIKKLDENATPKRSLQPLYGTNEAGETVLLQPDDAGNANQMKLPPGVKIAAGMEKVDTGTEFIFMDRKTGQVVSRQPKDVAGKEAQEAIGASQGKMAGNAPAAISNADKFLKNVEETISHPSFNASVFGGGLGAPGKFFRNVPGTEAYGFNKRIEQLQGQTFLDAYDSLKGGGAITDIEGAKATAARARLDAAQSPKDFKQALDELKEIISTGAQRAREMGSKFGTVKQPSAAPSPASGGFRVIGVQ
jgi:hypothetical protein